MAAFSDNYFLDFEPFCLINNPVCDCFCLFAAAQEKPSATKTIASARSMRSAGGFGGS